MIYNPTISQQVQDLNKAIFEAYKKNGTAVDTNISNTNRQFVVVPMNKYIGLSMRIEDEYFYCNGFLDREIDSDQNSIIGMAGQSLTVLKDPIIVVKNGYNGQFPFSVTVMPTIRQGVGVPLLNMIDMELYYIIADTYEELMSQLNA